MSESIQTTNDNTTTGISAVDENGKKVSDVSFASKLFYAKEALRESLASMFKEPHVTGEAMSNEELKTYCERIGNKLGFEGKVLESNKFDNTFVQFRKNAETKQIADIAIPTDVVPPVVG